MFKSRLTSGIDLISLYDTSGEIIAFSSSGDNGLPIGGIASFSGGALSLRDHTGLQQIEVDAHLIPIQLAKDVMVERDADAGGVAYLKHDDSIHQRIVVPVYRQRGVGAKQRVAWLMVRRDIDDSLFIDHAIANNLHFTSALSSMLNPLSDRDASNVLLDSDFSTSESSITFNDNSMSSKALIHLDGGELLTVMMTRNRSDISFLGEKLKQSGLIVLVIFVLIIATLGTYLLNRHISRPIQLLAKNVASFKEGDTSSLNVELSRTDEIGALMTAFSDMGRSLGNREMELRQLNNNLEKRVSIRTEELAQANEDLQSTFAELQVKQQEVQRSEKLSAIGKMVAGFAHELNNPLMGLRAYLDVIENTFTKGSYSDDADSVEAIEKAGKTVERLTRIVKNILHHTTVQEFQFTKFSVQSSVNETVHLFSVGSMDHDLIVNVNIEDDLPPVWCDDSSLKQVILNILINARDAVANSKEKIIEVTASADEEYVSITISDTGAGIPDEYISKVFDPFFTSKAPGKGTGLGLSVSNDLIRIIKGKMRCQNRAEGGAEFVVDVPVYKE